jgi:hypothetical protein
MSDALQEALNVLKAIVAPGITLAAVWLGWWLSVSSQRAQRRLDRLNDRFAALSEVMNVVDNVPPDLTGQQLVAKLESDEEFQKSLVHRLVRLFGLRNELIASLDRELVGFVETRFRPLFVARVGSCELPPDRVPQFGAAAFDLRSLVQRVELKLLAEQEKLAK